MCPDCLQGRVYRSLRVCQSRKIVIAFYTHIGKIVTQQCNISIQIFYCYFNVHCDFKNQELRLEQGNNI